MDSVDNIISTVLGSEIISESHIGGGCSAHTSRIDLSDGRQFFLKTGQSKSVYLSEAKGLNELSEADAIRVPNVIAIADEFLVLEYINSSGRSNDFYVKLGEGLARLHSYEGECYGLSSDNFIGATPQINIPEEDEKTNWAQFFINKRILYQYDLAKSNSYVDSEMSKVFNKLKLMMPDILDTSDAKPVLLHGDLWGGNYIVDEQGDPCLIDPAVYYGHREADLAMTRIFGRFPQEFYEAYNRTLPLANGWEYREHLYQLYHILNHLNLFGMSYYPEALSLMRHYV